MKKLSKQMNVSWQDNQSYVASAPNGLTKGATVLRWRHTAAHPSGPSVLGNLKVTWYCHMRGQVAP